MSKVIACLSGFAAVVAFAGCVDGSKTFSGVGEYEDVVTLDEAVVEVEIVEELAVVEPELEALGMPRDTPESDIVDLDLASDAG